MATRISLLSGRMALGILGITALLGGGLFRARVQAQEPAPTGKITPWAAMKIATEKVPGHALNATYEFDEGHWVYGVMVVTGGTKKEIKEVELDPTTGKVGDVEAVTPEGEAKEMTAELNKALGKTSNAKKESAEKDDEKDEKK